MTATLPLEPTGRSIAAGDVPLPAMALRDDAVEHNLRAMAALAAREGFELAPHVKTTLCPELIARQLGAGAWGVTVANVTQARVAADAGAGRILIANEVLGRPDAEWLAEASASIELLCLVDSVDGARLLDAGLQAAGCTRPVAALVEIGADGGRTGVRTRAAAHDVCRAIRNAPNLIPAGVEGYEGAVGSRRTAADLAAVDAYLEELRATAVELADAGHLDASQPLLVSAGGSKFFDRVIRLLGRDADFGGHASTLVLRSGCYVVHDHGLYAEVTPLGAQVPEQDRLQPAIEVWAEVLSCPEPGLVIVGLGRRDASFDSGLPVLIAAVRRDARELSHDVAGRLTKLDDQHGYLAVDPSDGGGLQVGDRLVFGISHPCTTFDKWRQVLLVDDERRVLRVLETRFH